MERVFVPRDIVRDWCDLVKSLEALPELLGVGDDVPGEFVTSREGVRDMDSEGLGGSLELVVVTLPLIDDVCDVEAIANESLRLTDFDMVK